jgi:hypothetical protein
LGVGFSGLPLFFGIKFFFLEILLFWQVIYDKTTGRSRGFGFVTMSTAEEVEAAAQQFNGYVSTSCSMYLI